MVPAADRLVQRTQRCCDSMVGRAQRMRRPLPQAPSLPLRPSSPVWSAGNVRASSAVTPACCPWAVVLSAITPTQAGQLRPLPRIGRSSCCPALPCCCRPSRTARLGTFCLRLFGSAAGIGVAGACLWPSRPAAPCRRRYRRRCCHCCYAGVPTAPHRRNCLVHPTAQHHNAMPANSRYLPPFTAPVERIVRFLVSQGAAATKVSVRQRTWGAARAMVRALCARDRRTCTCVCVCALAHADGGACCKCRPTEAAVRCVHTARAPPAMRQLQYEQHGQAAHSTPCSNNASAKATPTKA